MMGIALGNQRCDWKSSKERTDWNICGENDSQYKICGAIPGPVVSRRKVVRRNVVDVLTTEIEP
jgi:hypothetical protein